MTDNEFLAAFEAATLTRSEWTHEAHIRMAWLYARRERGILAALAKIRTGIKRLNGALGTDETLYHETVTCAFATLIYVRATQPGASDTWPAFRDANSELFDTYDPILLHHYRPETLASDEARRMFVSPDLRPLLVSDSGEPVQTCLESGAMRRSLPCCC